MILLANALARADIEVRSNGTGDAIAILQEVDSITNLTNITLETVAFLTLTFLEHDVVDFVDTARVDALSTIIVASFLTLATDKRVLIDLIETLITNAFAIGLRTTERRTLRSFWSAFSVDLNITLIADTFVSNGGTVLVAFFDALLLMLPEPLIADTSISNVLAIGRAGNIGDALVILLSVSVIANTSDSVKVRVFSTISIGRSGRGDDETDSDTVARVDIKSISGTAGASIVCPIGELEIGAVLFRVCLDELFSTLAWWRSLRLWSWSGCRGRLRIRNI